VAVLSVKWWYISFCVEKKATNFHTDGRGMTSVKEINQQAAKTTHRQLNNTKNMVGLEGAVIVAVIICIDQGQV